MSKLITGKINLSKIDKTKLFKGQKGIYLNLTLWLNDATDQYGNILSIEQSTTKEEKKLYIGSGKLYIKKEPEPIAPEPSKEVSPIVPEILPGNNNEMDDLPF